MFEIIREKKKVLLFVLLGLVIPPFIVVGAWDQFSPNREPVVATIDGVDIQKIGLDHLRSSMAIIPQTAFSF